MTLILLLSVGIQNTLTINCWAANVLSRPRSSSDVNPTSARPKPTPSASPSERPNIVPPDLQAAKDLLNACDKALSNCEAVIKAKENIIAAQDKIIVQQGKDLDDVKGQRDSILRSPILWGIIGIAIGGIAVGIIKR